MKRAYSISVLFLVSLQLLVGCSTNNSDIVIGKNIKQVIEDEKKIDGRSISDNKKEDSKTNRDIKEDLSAKYKTYDLSDKEKVKVLRVIDGDTFELTNGSKVRLIGVNTPETVKANTPVQAYGKEASDFTKKMLTGKTVYMAKDVGDTDKYGRLLRYVFLEDGKMYNEILAREGYARVMTIQPNVQYQKLFLQAERDAKGNNRGLWAR